MEGQERRGEQEGKSWKGKEVELWGEKGREEEEKSGGLWLEGLGREGKWRQRMEGRRGGCWSRDGGGGSGCGATPGQVDCQPRFPGGV